MNENLLDIINPDNISPILPAEMLSTPLTKPSLCFNNNANTICYTTLQSYFPHSENNETTKFYIFVVTSQIPVFLYFI